MTFQEIVKLSLDPKVDVNEHECSVTLNVNHIEVNAYAVSIAYRDILFFTDKGTVSFVVDSYGDKNLIEQVDWDLEGVK